MSEGQPKISGAELKLQHETIRREVLRQVDDMRLRQWAVEQAVKACPADIEVIKEITEYWYNFAKEKPNA